MRLPLSPSSEHSSTQRERARETERILGILHQWGIHTIGQLAALQRDELAARLGARAVDLWERAQGKTKRLLKLVAPPESFMESFEFESEVETVEPLLFILRRFLQQLALRLGAIYLVAGQLRFRLIFSDKTHYERLFKIPQPTNSESILFRMLHTHLENFTAEHPIVAVELEATPTRSARQQFGLFETALRDPTQLHETLARLVGLLGAERVGTPVLEETHRPDAFRMEPFVWEWKQELSSVKHPLLPSEEVPVRLGREECDRANPPSADPNETNDYWTGRASLRRFRQRAQATVLLEDGKPAHLRAAEVEGMTVHRTGPFPLSGNWWDETRWARIEWDLELENGTVARCHCDEEGWAVDGIYD